MNKEVSFPIAKLLKEKEFDEVSQKWYSVEGSPYYRDELDNHRRFVPAYECEAPTVDEVKWWLYDKHGIWICVKKDYHNGALLSFETTIDSEQGLVDVGTFATPEQAYEAAILYTLNNLI